jgi:hypothetical protein
MLSVILIKTKSPSQVRHWSFMEFTLNLRARPFVSLRVTNLPAGRQGKGFEMIHFIISSLIMNLAIPLSL